jgi:SAM-dependent methyltransferase
MNSYSPKWFSTFLSTVPPAQTESEVEYLRQCLPPAEFLRILDVCCGSGRHLVPLWELGYAMTGIDADQAALAIASQSMNGRKKKADLQRRDMRDPDFPEASFDAVLILWQSFGFFDPVVNKSILATYRKVLRSGGRLILDIYNREFFPGKNGSFTHERAGIRFRETRKLSDGYLFTSLEYDSGERDDFQWQLFDLPEIQALGEECGFRLLSSCSRFDASQPVLPTEPRMQLLFEKLENPARAVLSSRR